MAPRALPVQYGMLADVLVRLKGHLIDRFSKYRDCYPAATSVADAGKDALDLLREVTTNHSSLRVCVCVYVCVYLVTVSCGACVGSGDKGG
jgi:hypothetical protein